MTPCLDHVDTKDLLILLAIGTAKAPLRLGIRVSASLHLVLNTATKLVVVEYVLSINDGVSLGTLSKYLRPTEQGLLSLIVLDEDSF